MLRTLADTARAPTASAMPDAVQASALPISTPAPSMTPSKSLRGGQHQQAR